MSSWDTPSAVSVGEKTKRWSAHRNYPLDEGVTQKTKGACPNQTARVVRKRQILGCKQAAVRQVSALLSNSELEFKGLHFGHIHEQFYKSSKPTHCGQTPIPGSHTHNCTNTVSPLCPNHLHTPESPPSSPLPGVNSNRISLSSFFEFLRREEKF